MSVKVKTGIAHNVVISSINFLFQHGAQHYFLTDFSKLFSSPFFEPQIALSTFSVNWHTSKIAVLRSSGD